MACASCEAWKHRREDRHRQKDSVQIGTAVQGNEAEHQNHDHSHGNHQDHRMYGGWDTAVFPTAVNLYRLMNAVAELEDTADRGNPSLAEMFVANFSTEYIRYRPDSQSISKLRLLLGNGLDLYITGANFDEATQVVIPRLARVLDLLRFDSAHVFYYTRSLNGSWILPKWGNYIPSDTMYPSARVFPAQGPVAIAGYAALRKPEMWLLEVFGRQ